MELCNILAALSFYAINAKNESELDAGIESVHEPGG